jgi:two-component system response regulator FixJ
VASRRTSVWPALVEPREHRGRVFVVDDDAGVRDATTLLLETAGFEVTAYESGEAFLGSAGLHSAGCVLLDVRLPGMGGLDVQSALTRLGSRLSVVVLTGYADIPISVAAMRAGAADFIEKPYQPDRLIAAIDQALGGGAAEPVSRPRAQAGRLVDTLSPRQRQVLSGLVAGHSNKAIARDLALSPRTVEMHRADMMERLGVESLSEALRIAYDAGLIVDRRAAHSPARAGGRRAGDPAAASCETSG